MQVAKIMAIEVIKLVEKSAAGLLTLLDLISLQPSEEKCDKPLELQTFCNPTISASMKYEGEKSQRKCLQFA